MLLPLMAVPERRAVDQVVGVHYYSLAEKRQLAGYWAYLADVAAGLEIR